jgi:hypothetical protein
MAESLPPAPPAIDSEDQDAKELAKLTTNFYAALNDLLPAAIRASKRGKHGLLRLISRKLPRPKLPQPEDTDEDRAQDEDVAEIANAIRAVFERPPEMPPAAIEREVEKKEEGKKEEPPKPKEKTIAPTAPPPAIHTRITSGAPRSLNEEPWPGQNNFPRPALGTAVCLSGCAISRVFLQATPHK